MELIRRKLFRRCVGRANNNANANGGLVYSNSNNDSSNSNTNNGVRLAIILKINRSYGKSLRDSEYLRMKERSLGKSNIYIGKPEHFRVAVYER